MDPIYKKKNYCLKIEDSCAICLSELGQNLVFLTLITSRFIILSRDLTITLLLREVNDNILSEFFGLVVLKQNKSHTSNL